MRKAGRMAPMESTNRSVRSTGRHVSASLAGLSLMCALASVACSGSDGAPATSDAGAEASFEVGPGPTPSAPAANPIPGASTTGARSNAGAATPTPQLPAGVRRIVEHGELRFERDIPCSVGPVQTALRGDTPPYRCEDCSVGAECDLGLECIRGKITACNEGRAVCGEDGPLPSGRSCGTGNRRCDGNRNCVCPAGWADCAGVCRSTIGSSCSVGVGMCARVGTFVCNGADVVCSAIAAMAGREICDGVDNDCNGLIDDVMSLGCSPNECQEGVTTCSGSGAGICTATTNKPRGSVCRALSGGVCNGAGTCVCPAGFVACNGDCLPDSACTVGRGECTAMGTQVCQAGSLVCGAVAGSPRTETCNGRDDDCDGVNDNVSLPVAGIGLLASFVPFMTTPPDPLMPWPHATEVWSRIDPGPSVLLPLPPPPAVDTDFSAYGGRGDLQLPSANNWAARWSGYLLAPGTGVYTIQVEANQGAALYLAGAAVPVANNWATGPGTFSFPITLTQGLFVPIELRYFKTAGAPRVALRWSGPGIGATPVAIRSAYLLPARDINLTPQRPVTNGFIAAYFPSTGALLPNQLRFEPTPTSMNPTHALNQTITDVHPLQPASGGYHVRWTGVFIAPRDGVTQFRATGMGNITMRINGAAPFATGMNTAMGNFTTTARSTYRLEVDLLVPADIQDIHLEWQLPGSGSFVPVPASHVYAVPDVLPPCTGLPIANDCAISTDICSPSTPLTCLGLTPAPAGVVCRKLLGGMGTCNGAGLCM